jgi:hypothetical protein
VAALWRVALSLTALVGLATASPAAPAPVPKPPRHAPSPATLLADFRTEGFAVRSLDRGPEPGSYVISLRAASDAGLYVASRRYVVRVGDSEVRSAIRACLEKDRENARRQLRYKHGID